MAVNIIRKQSGQANEVTDAMLEAAMSYLSNDAVLYPPITGLYKAMEAARICEGGEIERIDITSHYGDACAIYSVKGFISTDNLNSGVFDRENLIPLAEALLELGKQMKGAV